MLEFENEISKASSLCLYIHHAILTSVTPKGMFPTYNRRACRLIALPANGTEVSNVNAALGTVIVCGICPAAKRNKKKNF